MSFNIEDLRTAVAEKVKALNMSSVQPQFDDSKKSCEELNLLTWLEFAKKNPNNMADHTYGIRFDKEDEQFKMGSIPIKYKCNDLVIDGEVYPGSKDLFELVFLRNPHKGYLKHYNHADLESYLRMLLKTKSYVNPSTMMMKGSRGAKYKNIIKPLLKSLPPSSNSNASNFTVRSNTPDTTLWDIEPSTSNFNVSRMRKRTKLPEGPSNKYMKKHSGEGLKNETLPDTDEETYYSDEAKETSSVADDDGRSYANTYSVTSNRLSEENRSNGDETESYPNGMDDDVSSENDDPYDSNSNLAYELKDIEDNVARRIYMDVLNMDLCQIDYKHWDDPNILVNKLKLLIESRNVGNFGHTDEIITILRELTKEGIIEDFANFKL